MLYRDQIRELSPQARKAAFKKVAEAYAALDYFDAKLAIAFHDDRISAQSRKFLKKVWRHPDDTLSLGNRAVREAAGEAMILATLKHCKENSHRVSGTTRLRLATFSPDVGILPIESSDFPVRPVISATNWAFRKCAFDGLAFVDLELFCPKRGLPVDRMAIHAHVAMSSNDKDFKPRAAEGRMAPASGPTNALGAPITVIRTRGRKRGGHLIDGDIAGLGWYTTKLTCGISTCYESRRGTRTESSHTGWTTAHALRQLEFWSHLSAYDACWSIGDGKALRAEWKRQLHCQLGYDKTPQVSPIDHSALAAQWDRIWTEVASPYQAFEAS